MPQALVRVSASLALLASLAASPVLAIAVGDLAPPVNLPDQNGKARSVADSYGRWAVLTFYPADSTSGCTKEAISITRSLGKLVDAGIDVFGVSVQDVKSKQEFCAKNELRHVLLSDVDKAVCKEYDTLRGGAVSKRVTFIIDPARTVRVIDEHVNVDTHGEDILKKVGELKADDAKGYKLAEATADFGGRTLHLPDGWTAQPTTVNTSVVWAGPGGETLTLGGVGSGGNLPDGAKIRAKEAVGLGDAEAQRLAFTAGGRYTESLTWGTTQVTVSGPEAKSTELSLLLAGLVR